MSVVTTTLKRLMRLVPPDNQKLYRLCKYYVDRYRGENNDDFTSNGELRFLKQVLHKCTLVFDVGANVGEWAALALQVNPHLRPGARKLSVSELGGDRQVAIGR